MNASNRKNHVRRSFPRRSASADVKAILCKIGLSDITSNVNAAILDLSEAGARLLGAVPLEVGEEVVVVLEGPSCHGPLTRHGKVVWSFQATKRSYAVGVRFEEHFADEDIEEVTISPVRLDY